MEEEKEYIVDIIAALAERTIRRLWIVIALQSVLCISLLVCLYTLTH